MDESRNHVENCICGNLEWIQDKAMTVYSNKWCEQSLKLADVKTSSVTMFKTERMC